MTIVKGLIERMNGTINVSSKEGEGSVFVITIPFDIAPAPAELPDKSSPAKCDINGLKLMLVEDNELNAEIAETLLSDQGAKVTTAADGKQAVQLFRNNPPNTFDAILMDIMMPVMDGLTATRTIRETDRADAKTIPIIAMTANAFKEDAQKCLDAGMNGHLAKPIVIEDVVKNHLRTDT